LILIFTTPPHHREQLARGGEQILARRGVVDQRGQGQEERTFLRQEADV
jgi:hypothetical protein